jgi:hypothetical protein
MIDFSLTDNPDVWEYEWGAKFLPSRYYASLHAHLLVPAVFKWIWKSACMMNTKVFAWLLLNDRLNTKDLLVRRHWKVAEDNFCKLCPTRTYEDRLHLFSPAISVAESGSIFRLIGQWVRILSRLWPRLKRIS